MNWALVVVSFCLMELGSTTLWWILSKYLHTYKFTKTNFPRRNTGNAGLQKLYRPIFTMWSYGKHQDIGKTTKKTCSVLKSRKKSSHWSRWIALVIASCLVIGTGRTVNCPFVLLISVCCIAMSWVVHWLDWLVCVGFNRMMHIFSVDRTRWGGLLILWLFIMSVSSWSLRWQAVWIFFSMCTVYSDFPSHWNSRPALKSTWARSPFGTKPKRFVVVVY